CTSFVLFHAYAAHRALLSSPTRRSSDLSSKITSSIFEPVSTSAEARMVSEPPCSMLRAAPKKRLGGYSAEASTPPERIRPEAGADRKSTRLNSSHVSISYAVFCLKPKKR